ncbi:MAG: D-alanine--D-alanine ligase [Clostridiales bacterium]|nr:D-alanine--D-alanine ligase [Clostridiales bacterium]
MIAVFFGGTSCEHDISIITGLQAMNACPVKYKCVGVYIDPDGEWWAVDPKGVDSAAAVRQKKFKKISVHIRPAEPYLYTKNKRLHKIDAALLCMHGMRGEDGALQGMLDMCGVPYTGSDVCASAIGMNKLMSKVLFEKNGLSVLPYAPIIKPDYERDATVAVKQASELGYPVIVKPCNLGSSIGISIAKTPDELYASLRVAFEWDDTVIIEKALEDFIEINCAVLGDSITGKIEVSDTEQPVGWKSFLTFDDKYSGDVKQTRHKIPAEVDDEITARIKEQAVTAFKSIGASGIARIDFLVKGDDVFVNEINTIPGSLSNALFRSSMSFSTLIQTLIDTAFNRESRRKALKRSYTPVTPIIGK